MEGERKGRGREGRRGERRGKKGRGGGKGKERVKGKGRTTAIPNFFRPWRFAGLIPDRLILRPQK